MALTPQELRDLPPEAQKAATELRERVRLAKTQSLRRLNVGSAAKESLTEE